MGLGRIWSFVLGFQSLVAARAIWKRGNKFSQEQIFSGLRLPYLKNGSLDFLFIIVFHDH